MGGRIDEVTRVRGFEVHVGGGVGEGVVFGIIEAQMLLVAGNRACFPSAKDDDNVNEVSAVNI